MATVIVGSLSELRLLVEAGRAPRDVADLLAALDVADLSELRCLVEAGRNALAREEA